MNIDYSTLGNDIEDGTLRARLEQELTEGFRQMHLDGERLPPASYYATKIVEVIHSGTPVPLTQTAAFDLYQEVLLACEGARIAILGEPDEPPLNPDRPANPDLED